MHRPGWNGPGSFAIGVEEDGPQCREELHGYSKEHKVKQPLGARVRRLLGVSPEKLPNRDQLLLILALLLMAGAFAWLAHATQAVPVQGGEVPARYQSALDLLIQEKEERKQQLLAEVQPTFNHWKGLQAEMRDKTAKADKARENRRLLKSGAYSNVTAAMNPEQQQQELRKAEEWVEQTEADERDVQRREAEGRQALESRHRQYLDLVGAIQGFRRQKVQEEALVDGGAAGGVAVEQDASILQRAERDWTTMIEGGAASYGALREQGRTGDGLRQLVSGSDSASGKEGIGQEVVAEGAEAGQLDQQAGAEQQEGALGKEAAGGVVQVVNNAKQVEAARRAELEVATRQQVRAADSAGMGFAAEDDRAGSEAKPEEDDSVRCRTSGICDGAAACGRAAPASDGVDLGCLTDSAERAERVKQAARWTWQAYKKCAWGQDELLPLSCGGQRWFGLGLTLVDGLDTLQLMGLREEYGEAREWIAKDMRVDQDEVVNLFETTIRVLGGLLAAYHLSGGDRLFLTRAAQLGLRLSPAFVSSSGIAYSDVNLATHKASSPAWGSDSSLSEVTTLDMEFSYLARISGHQELEDAALAVVRKVGGMRGRKDGLVSMWVGPETGRFTGNTLTLGARGDSYYEYLLKQWLLAGKRSDWLLHQYKEAMRGVRKHLLHRTSPAPGQGLMYVAELHGATVSPKMDHLVCFLPGVLALGHYHGVNTAAAGQPDDLAIARELMRSCYEMYRRTPTGLAPEIVFFSPAADFPKAHVGDVGGGDFMIKQQDSHNLLRPETAESLWVLWRVTGELQYREWGWQIFRAFEMHCRVEGGGYANLDSVLQVPAPQRDKMESFWLAETLKYLFLLLDASEPALLPLDRYIMNTEAHPLPIAGSPPDAALAGQYLPPGFRDRLPTAEELPDELKVWEAREAELLQKEFPAVWRLRQTLAERYANSSVEAGSAKLLGSLQSSASAGEAALSSIPELSIVAEASHRRAGDDSAE